MKIPTIETEIYDAFPQEKPRPHLGLSLAGHPCDRWLWLTFRWAVIERFDGRMLRLFRRGQMEEIALVNDLKRAGYTVTEALEDQRFIDCGWHVGGSPDGNITGIHEAPDKEHNLEMKTSNKKSFDAIVRNGCEKEKPLHYIQQQCYMKKKGQDRSLYIVVCKDDDMIYTERVKLDEEIADKYIARLQRITQEEHIPAPITDDPDWYQCRFCPAHDFCFGDKKPEVNCRTCAHMTVKEDSIYCERWGQDIPTDGQRQGCRSHVIHPDLVDAKMTEYDEWSCYYDGILVGESGVSSKDFLEMSVDAIASAFDGVVIR